jgi:hypothetical protein
MTVTEIVDGHSGEEIEIGLAIDIPQPATLAALCNDRVAAIGFHDIFVGSVDPVCGCTHIAIRVM